MITVFLGAMAGLLMALHLGAVALFLRRLQHPGPGPGLIGQPFVTLLRPVCGLDAFDGETLASSFQQDYPGYEVIFCAQSPEDPAAELVARLIAQNPQVPARLLIGDDAITGNPKLNNLWKGWHAARADWVCMTDANLALPRDYLATVVASWGPRTGCVSAPPVGAGPVGLGGHLECAFLNTNQAIVQFGVASLGQGFAQGKTLFFNKPLIESAGGLRRLGRTLAEDVATTKLIRSLGLEVTLTPLPFAQPIGHRRLKQVWDRQLRWSRVRRDGFAPIFLIEPLNGGMIPALCVIGALAGNNLAGPGALAYVALWYLAEVALARRARWPMGAQGLAALILRDLMIPALWAATFLRRGFEWRGTQMRDPRPQAKPSR